MKCILHRPSRKRLSTRNSLDASHDMAHLCRISGYDEPMNRAADLIAFFFCPLSRRILYLDTPLGD